MKTKTLMNAHPAINNEEDGENMSDSNTPSKQLMLTANGSNIRPGSSSQNFQSAFGGSGT